MPSESIANFQALIVSLAAIAGTTIAGMGLWTWKQQTRWQQGRGLAVNLLQAFFEFQDRVNEIRRFSYSKPDETLSETEKLAVSQEVWNRAKDHDDKLSAAFGTFQKCVAEAIVVWDEDFKEIMSDLQDVKHIASSLVLTGAGSMDPRRTLNARNASATLYQAFSGDYYGTSDDRRGVGGRLAEVQSKIKAKIDQQGLN